MKSLHKINTGLSDLQKAYAYFWQMHGNKTRFLGPDSFENHNSYYKHWNKESITLPRYDWLFQEWLDAGKPEPDPNYIEL